MTSARRGRALVLLAALLTAGCAAADDDGDHAGHPSTTPAAAASSAAAAPDARAVVLEVRLAGGAVTPADTRVDVAVGQPVELVVDSDTTDVLHVHSSPDHSFPVAAGSGQRFRFTVDVPGRVEIELHDSGRTVATLFVR